MEGNRAILWHRRLRKKGKALSLTCSNKIPTGFILEHTTWNSFKCLLGSSPARPWKVGNKWIIPDLSSKATSNYGISMHNGCWSSVGTTNSFRVWFLAKAIGGLGKMDGGGVGIDGGVEEEWEWEGWWEKEETSCLKELVNSRMFFNLWSCATASSSSLLINSICKKQQGKNNLD